MRQSPNIIILRLPKPLPIRGVGISKFNISKYIIQNIYFTGYISNKPVKFYVKRKLHIIKKLNTKVFINLDIIRPKNFTLNILEKIITIT